VLGLLGKGGMGSVHLAFDPELGRRLAVKILHTTADANGAERDVHAKARLLREAKSLARVSHPNIVPIYDVGSLNDHAIYLAMEFVPGSSLRDLLVKKRISPEVATNYVLQAGQGLAAAHVAGLVHRDLKPENLWVGDDGLVRVLDFGLAKDLEGPVTTDPDLGDDYAGPATTGQGTTTQWGLRTALDHITGAGSWLGTPAYMAPEQIRGGVCDARTDAFALACVLFEVTCGLQPFPSLPLESRRKAIEAGEIRWPKTISRRLKFVLTRALAAGPEHRHESMDAFLSEVRSARRRTKAQNKLALAASLFVFVSSGIHLARGIFEEPSDPWCQDPSERLADLWNSATIESSEQNFRGMLPNGGQQAWSQSASAVEKWRASWLLSAKSLCIASDLDAQDRLLAQRQRDLSWACLSESKAEFSAIMELWRQPTLEQVLEGKAAVDSLSKPAQCIDPVALAQRPLLPRDPTKRVEVSRLRSLVKAAKVYCDQSDYKRAHDELQAIKNDVEATQDIELLADYSFTLAWLAYHASTQDPRTIAPISRARLFSIAADRPNYNSMMLTRAWYLLVYAGSQIEFSDELLRENESVIRAAGSPPDLLTRYARDHAILGSIRGDFVQTERRLLEALRYAQKSGNQEDIAWRYDDLGYSAYILGTYELALTYHRSALEIRESLYGPVHPDSLRSRSQISLALTRLSRPLDALEVSQKALGACLGARQDNSLCGATMLDVGQIEAVLGREESAITTLLGVDHIETTIGRRVAQTEPWSISRLAPLLAARGEVHTALELAELGVERIRAELRFHPRALSIALINVGWIALAARQLDRVDRAIAEIHGQLEKSSENRNELAPLLIHLEGALAFARGRDAVAIAALEVALAEAQNGSPAQTKIPMVRDLSRALRRSGFAIAALERAEEAIALAEQIRGLSLHHVIPLYVERAEALTMLGKHQEAWQSLVEAQRAMSEDLEASAEIPASTRAAFEFAQAKAHLAVDDSAQSRQEAARQVSNAQSLLVDNEGQDELRTAIRQWLTTHGST
jgi:serine/threonine protein kinase